MMREAVSYGYFRMGDNNVGHLGRSRASGWNICRASPFAVSAKKAMARGQQNSGMARGNNYVA